MVVKSNRSRYGYRWLAAGTLLILSACAFFHPEKGLKSCRYRFQNLAFSGMDAGQTHWRLDMAVTNPNSHPVTLTRMRFAILHEADTLLTGWNPTKREIAARDSQVLQTTLDIPNSMWKRLPSGIWSDTDARFLIIADAYLDTWAGQMEVPGAMRQTIHVNMPQQMAKYRDMMMQKLFSWPGHRVEEDVSPPAEAAPPATSDSAL